MADWREDEVPSRARRPVGGGRSSHQQSNRTATAASVASSNSTILRGRGAEENTLDVVEKSRQEREERARRKRQETEAVRLQATVRGWLARIRIRKELEAEIQRKLQDIEKIESVLRAAKKEFALPANASIRLTRCAWMVHRLRIQRISQSMNRTQKRKWSEVQTTTENVLGGVAGALCGTVRNRSLETIWDDGARLRTKCLIQTELKRPLQWKLNLCRAMLQSEFFFEWINYAIFMNEPLVRARLIAVASSTTPVVDLDAVEVLLIGHTNLLRSRKLKAEGYLYATLLFSIPGLFLKVSSMEMFQTLLQPKENWDALLRILTTFPPLIVPDDQYVQDELVLSRLGNLCSFFTKVPQISLESDLAMEATWRLFQRLPINTFAGTEGVAWTSSSRGVAKVNTLTLTQLDLPHVCTVMTERCLKVNEYKDQARRDSNRNEWEGIKQGVTTAGGDTGGSSKRRIFSIMSGSSWAKKLGWSSSKREHDQEEEEATALLPIASKLDAQLGNANKQMLFLREAALSDFLKTLAIYLLKWPPKSTNPKTLAVLNALAFSSASTVDLCWAFAESKFERRTRKPDILDEFWASSFVFVFIAVHFLLVTDESELYENSVPMSRAALERCVTKLNEALYALDFAPNQQPKKMEQASEADEFAKVYIARSVRMLTQLRDLHSRRALTRELAWLADKTATTTPPAASSSSFFFSLLPTALGGRNESGQLSLTEQLYFDNHLFWCVPFYRRAKWFTDRIATERVIHQPTDAPPTYKLSVRRRNGGLDEAFPFFLKSDLRKRVYVVFVNEFGLPEAGIDSRGLFKEFIQTLAEIVFDPKRGLFAMAQEGDRGLFPNPKARVFADLNSKEDTLSMFQFAGKLLGKALFEGIVVQPEFSFFILAKLLGKLVTISDLASLDQDLFRNLLFLKNTKQDVRDLCLNFSVTSAANGKEVELFPGGSQVEVTSANKFKYVNAVAHYRLNVENREEHDAFVNGFRSVIAPEWIAPFSERELQTLLSGSGGKIDVQDWKGNCSYGGGYFATSQIVLWFWDIVERDMSNEERQLLLRFVTACTRPPLLGFAQLEPRFQIHRVALEDMQLPTSSTCFNTLKIPAYPSKAVLKEKLMKAIKSGAGFELT